MFPCTGSRDGVGYNAFHILLSDDGMNPQRVDFLTFRLLLAVAQTGSITKAAESLHLALGAASTRIRELEETLGVALLERHARGVRFTEAGNALLHRARAIERELAQLEFEMGDYAAGVVGHLRMVANASSVATTLPADLTGFLQAHPKVRIDLSEHTSQEIQRMVANGDAELGVFAGETQIEHIATFPYHADTLMVLAPMTLDLDVADSIAIERVLEEDLILLQEGGSIQQWITDQGRRLGRPARIRVQAKGFDAICQLVAAGLGITVMPGVVARRFARLLDLRLLAIEGAPTARAIKLCVHRTRPLSPVARDLLAFLQRRGDDH